MFKLFKNLEKKDRCFILMALVFIVAQVWLDLKLPDYMSEITVLVETPDSSMQDILIAGGKMLACAFGSLVSGISVAVLAAKSGIDFAATIREKLFHKVQDFSMEEIGKFSTASLITRTTNDVSQIQILIVMGLQAIAKAPIMAVWAILKIYNKSWQWTASTGVALVILLLIVITCIVLASPKFKKMQVLTDNLNRVTRENLTGLNVIRAFNKQDDEFARFKNKNEELNHLQKFVGKISGLMNPLTYTVVNVSIIALIWVGAIRVNQGGLTQGQVVALYNYMSQILVELIKLANLVINITKALACAGRIESIFEVQPSMKDGSMDLSADKENVPVVEFKNVALKYNGAGDTSIAGVNFKAYRGQTIGIIGGTGSGKSSLVGLIPRFYDATSGEVLINGTNVKDINIEQLRDKVGIVMQKAVLFKGSIRKNIQMAKADATDKEIDDALAIAQAKEFVDKKKGRLDYMIEQGGKNLSGGQRQRLTIARAVVKKPDVLILDDSASALDFATDAALRKSIRTMPNNPTVFIVSQRSASLMHADKIIVLDDGEVAGIGTHTELLENCEVYREIYNSQFKS